MDKAKIAPHTGVNAQEVLATFLAVKWAECNRLAQTLQISGTTELVNEFIHTLGVQNEIAE